jgi:cell wall-associated NlpC family hydrolase
VGLSPVKTVPEVPLMPLVDALQRVQQIQATLVRFQPTTSTTGSASAFSAVLGATSADGSTAASSASAATPSTLTATPTSTSANGVSGEDIVNAAKKYIGVPYVFGGEDANGMDCSGLVQRVLADLGIDAPRVVSTQQNIGVQVPSLAEAQPGDLIVTNNADHIVIYAGNGQIIHAPYVGRDVSLQKNYLTDADIKTIRRVTVEPTAVATVAASSSLTAALNSLANSKSGSATGTGTGSVSSTADLIAAAQMSLFSGATS